MASIPSSTRSKILLFLSAAAAFSIPSCSGRDPNQEPVYSVSGQILVQGQPAENALVVFHPVGSEDKDAVRPSGHVGPDGQFALGTYKKEDGAPVGEYAITVVWPKPPAGPLADPDLAPDRLRGRYANPAKSPLRAHVEASENRLPPFDLK